MSIFHERHRLNDPIYSATYCAIFCAKSPDPKMAFFGGKMAVISPI